MIRHKLRGFCVPWKVHSSLILSHAPTHYVVLSDDNHSNSLQYGPLTVKANPVIFRTQLCIAALAPIYLGRLRCVNTHQALEKLRNRFHATNSLPTERHLRGARASVLVRRAGR